MHSLQMRAEARELFASGWSKKQIAEHFHVARATVRVWCTETMPTDNPRSHVGRCPRCQTPPALPEPADRYAYLLGQYLGDGHLAMTVRIPMLRVACAAVYPDIMDEVEAAMRAVLANSVCRVRAPGCAHLTSYSTHWPCLLPQHGPGMKHLRRIELADWQETIVAAHPRQLLRGLIHSDGTRVRNTVHRHGRDYHYPRYLFVNQSADILRICGQALDRVGARWRYNRTNCLSVARKESVALLDTFIGPKS